MCVTIYNTFMNCPLKHFIYLSKQFINEQEAGHENEFITLEVIKAVTMKITVFWMMRLTLW
jgi:hypothetical protein